MRAMRQPARPQLSLNVLDGAAAPVDGPSTIITEGDITSDDVRRRFVERIVLRAVEREARAVYVPWIGRIFVALDFLFPQVMDAYLHSKTR